MKRLSLMLVVLLGLAQPAAFAAGAIAVNDEEGAATHDYAMASDAMSMVDAGDQAIQECRSHGGKSCVIAVRFNRCGALAINNMMYRVGVGATAAEASRKALESCPRCNLAQVACESDNPVLTAKAR